MAEFELLDIPEELPKSSKQQPKKMNSFESKASSAPSSGGFLGGLFKSKNK
jgi:hypothetical protein